MFARAVEWEWRSDNPCTEVARYDEEKRERFLTPDELGRLLAAIAAYPVKRSANAIRLLLLTGARRGEVLRATWDQFDLEAGIWTKPSSHTKQKKRHRVPLSAPAQLLLNEMRRDSHKASERGKASPFVFPGASADEPLADIKKAWAAICGKAGLAERIEKRTKAGKIVRQKRNGQPVMIWRTTVRVHDLRHTYASILASSGQSLQIIGALLGHTQASTTARYSHLLDDPLRQATARVGALVDSMAKKRPGARVVTIGERKRSRGP
jgi:integrase